MISADRYATRFASIAVGCLICTAHAEPIVLRFEPENYSFETSQFSDQLPDIRVYLDYISGGGARWMWPGLQATQWSPFDDPNPPPFFAEQSATENEYNATPLGAVVNDSSGPWSSAFTYIEPEVEWPEVFFDFSGSGCGVEGCDPYDLANSNGITGPGVYAVPMRFTQSAHGSDPHFAWLAFRIFQRQFAECENTCTPEPDDLITFNLMEYIGFGYETEPNTPITNGGGLCESDLNYDTVLDLADVQVFAQSFIGGSTQADLNLDGVFDLADIQRFIGSFLSGCAL